MMSHNEIRIAMAEVERFTHIDDILGHLRGVNKHGMLVPLPAYENDLNAVAQVEAGLTDEEHQIFRHELQIITNPKPNAWTERAWNFREYVSATALQRCEAILRVRFIWKEPHREPIKDFDHPDTI